MVTNTKKNSYSKRRKILDTIGWIGTGLILLGYGLYSTGIVPDVTIYHSLNLVGSISMAILSYYRRIWQPFVINTVFAIFAAIAIIRHFL